MPNIQNHNYELSSSNPFYIELLFIDLRDYHNLVEKFLKKEKDRFERDFNDINVNSKAKKEFNNEYHKLFINSIIERLNLISRQYPHNFRASFLVQIISLVESELKNICEEVQSKEKQKFSVHEIKGSDDLDKCKKYLTRLINLNISEFNKEWKFIKNCKLIRNRIVHHNSNIKEDDKHLIDLASSDDSIELFNSEISDGKTFIITDRKLIDDLLIYSENLLVRINNKLT